ncbi:MAG: T9SS type A sorting domain-containing protein [Saprospirales bacterium]|nr:T9SS type A sorting domain-containing protein [Saprospirales bacterium]
MPSFANIAITWTPVAPSEVTSTRLSDVYSIFPNPGDGLYSISGNIKSYEVRSIAGDWIQSGRGATVDIRHLPDGVYLFVLKTENGALVKKALKAGL